MTSKRTYLREAKIKRNESLKMYVDSVEMTDAVQHCNRRSPSGQRGKHGFKCLRTAKTDALVAEKRVRAREKPLKRTFM